MISGKFFAFISVVALLWFRPQDKPYIVDRIDIQEISFTKEDGSPWDGDASYPDVKIAIYTGADTATFVSQTFHNLNSDQLPVYVHTEERRIAVTNKEWRLVFLEDDKNSDEDEIMHEWTFTPKLGEDDMALKGKSNFGKYEVDLQFQSVDF